MAKEAVIKVYNAERNAEKIIDDAKDLATNIVEKSKAVAESIIKSQKKEAKAKAKLRTEFAQKAQEKSILIMQDRVKEEIESMKNEALTKKNLVPDIIIKAILR